MRYSFRLLMVIKNNLQGFFFVTYISLKFQVFCSKDSFRSIKSNKRTKVLRNKIVFYSASSKVELKCFSSEKKDIFQNVSVLFSERSKSYHSKELFREHQLCHFFYLSLFLPVSARLTLYSSYLSMYQILILLTN